MQGHSQVRLQSPKLVKVKSNLQKDQKNARHVASMTACPKSSMQPQVHSCTLAVLEDEFFLGRAPKSSIFDERPPQAETSTGHCQTVGKEAVAVESFQGADKLQHGS